MSQVIVNLFNGLPALVLTLPPTSTIDTLKHTICDHLPLSPNAQRITTLGGLTTYDDAPLFSTANNDSHPPIYNLLLRLPGGKGGFGSMLRAQGGKMAAHKTTNFEACRDLSGRRLKTVNDAKKMAEYLAKEPERKRKRQEEISKRIEEGLKEPEKQKIRYHDPDFVESHEKALDDVAATVERALQAKKKVAVVAVAAASSSSGSSKPAVSLSEWDEIPDDDEGDEDEEDEDEEEEEDDEEEEKDGEEDGAEVVVEEADDEDKADSESSDKDEE
ncbi:hypothetical protein HDV00_002477 [Rhizophlyctis rosea]|nr:hypothetical protein HDV00_002477 [Rhizophlyctis rosea]